MAYHHTHTHTYTRTLGHGPIEPTTNEHKNRVAKIRAKRVYLGGTIDSSHEPRQSGAGSEFEDSLVVGVFRV